MHLFKDRKEAGVKLAKALKKYRSEKSVLVLALPRGGVPVGYEIAKALGAELDALLVRKLGVPGHEELAMGAIAYGGVKVMNEDVVQSSEIRERDIQVVEERELRELNRRNEKYRGGKKVPKIKGRTVILADDGLATGATMRAAVIAAKSLGANKIVIASPVSARDTYDSFLEEVEEVVCLEIPTYFSSIGEWYRSFPQTSDEEVLKLLKKQS